MISFGSDFRKKILRSGQLDTRKTIYILLALQLLKHTDLGTSSSITESKQHHTTLKKSKGREVTVTKHLAFEVALFLKFFTP